jgi:hypothetical protein
VTTGDIVTVHLVTSTTGHYLDLAEHEERLARASQERGDLARAASRDAAFQDTAEELARQAADEHRRARAHFEAARRYQRLAVEHRESPDR